MEVVDGPFSREGLKAAARRQFDIAQALARVPGYDVWFRDTCTYELLDWGQQRRHRFADLELGEVVVDEFSATRSLVELRFVYRPNASVKVSTPHPFAESWSYDGRWRNTSCDYSLGPELPIMPGPVLTALATRLAGLTPTPPKKPGN